LKRTLLLVFLAALAVPGVASAARGVVVKVDRGTNTVAVARAHGRVSLLHVGSTARIHVGSRLEFSARTLSNGTLAATRVRVLGRAHRTHVRGTVLATRSGGVALSANGAVLTVARGAAAATPAVASKVEIEVEIENEDLEANEIRVISTTADAALIRGRLTINANGTIRVADEGLALTFTVPAGFDLTRFRTGDEVLAFFLRNADNSLSLKILVRDDNVREADDEHEDEGSGDGGGDDDGGHGDDHGSSGGGGDHRH